MTRAPRGIQKVSNRFLGLRSSILGPTGSLRGQLSRGFGASVLLKISESVFGLVISLVLARLLKPEGYGVYSFAVSTVGLLGVPAMIGLPTLVVREVSRFRAVGEYGLLRGILRRASQTTLVLSGLVGLGGSWYILMRYDSIGSVQANTLLWALTLVPLIALNRLRESTLLGLGRPFLALSPERLVAPVLMLLLVAANWVVGIRVDPSRAMVLNCVASFAALLAGWVFLRGSMPPQVRASSPSYDDIGWRRSVLPLALLAGLSTLMSQTDIFMLGLLSSKAEVGFYRVAFSGAALVLFFSTALNAVTQSHLARLHHGGEMAQFQKVLRLTSRSAFALAFPVAALLIFAGKPILSLVYGSAYTPAYATLAVLSLAQLFNVFTGPVYDALTMSGFERETLRAVLLSTGVNVLLNFLLIRRFGAVGAAVATSISIVLVNTLLTHSLWSRTGVWSPAFGHSPLLSRARRT